MEAVRTTPAAPVESAEAAAATAPTTPDVLAAARRATPQPFFVANYAAAQRALDALSRWQALVDEAGWVRWASPNLELVFSSACNTPTANLKSIAPPETKLEDIRSRMNSISRAAGQFHELMQRDTVYMEGQIAAIAGWVAQPDK